MNQPTIALSLPLVPDVPVDDSIARDAGYESVDFSINVADLLTSDELLALVRRAGEDARRAALDVFSFTMPAPADGALARALLQVIAETGARLCILQPHGVDYFESHHRLYQAFTSAATAAETTGITLALRAPFAGRLASPIEVRAWLDEACSHAVGAVVDLNQAANPRDWIETLPHEIVAFRGAEKCIRDWVNPLRRPAIVDLNPAR